MTHLSAVVALALLANIAAAQATLSGSSVRSHAGRRALMARDVEVQLARSAAPASVSAAATVMVFTDTGFVVAERGSNGVTCIVNRSWPASVEPHCYDREGAETLLEIEMRRTLMYHRGSSNAEVDRVIADGLASGAFRLPTRPCMTYMMSEAQQLIGDDGTPAGKWRPHIMIFYPYLTNEALGLASAPDMRVGTVSDAGKPTASIVIPMAQFIKVSPTTP